MEEEFNRDQANDVELVSDFAGERFPCGAGGIGDASWHDGGVQNVMNVDVFGDREGAFTAVDFARADH